MTVSLIPVIEFEPARYAHTTRPSPQAAPDEALQAWGDHWRAALSDAGIDELSPLRQGGWHVPITQLTRPSTLRTLVRVSLNDIEPDSVEEIPTLPGGYVLICGDAAIGPGCCSDFSTIQSWREAAGWQSSAWKMVWIGHPWTHVSAEADVLHFLQPTEEDPPKTFKPLIKVVRQDLLVALERAEQEINIFAERLRPICPELKLPMTKEQLVHILIWGHSA